MAYGIKYKLTFKNRQFNTNGIEDIYYLDILQKDFVGVVTNLEGASSPFILKYQSGDGNVFDAIVGIRASECEANYFNNGDIPLDSFYSEDDEEYRFDFYCFSVGGAEVNKLLWSGYMVQDNCQEEFAPPPYVVTLKGTDNLGLLKEITLDTALPIVSTGGKVSLFDIVKSSLLKAGIILPFRVYSNIYENSTNDRSDDPVATFLEQTFINPGVFQNSDGTFDDCYSILEKIFFHFNCQLCQADGYWNIIRFPEALLFTDNKITGTEFDLTGVASPVTVELDPNQMIYRDTATEIIFINANHIKQTVRPFKDVKLTFNYKQPHNLIRNLDLQETGVLINSFVIDHPGFEDHGYIAREYEVPYWFETGFGGQPDVFIRVISSPVIQSVDEIEVERYLVLSGGTFGGPFLYSSSFYLDKNDRVKVSFSVRTIDSQTGESANIFLFRVTDTVSGDDYKINWEIAGRQNGTWTTNGGAELHYGPGEDTINLNSFQVDSLGSPVEGYFSIGLNQLDRNSEIRETHYKDIRVEYIPYINETSRITGHYHLQRQDNEIKNKFDEEIFIDDSVKHSVAGTLLTNEITNDDYLTLTAFWHRRQIFEGRKLGQITSYERKLLSFRTHNIVEGSFQHLRYRKDGEIKFVSLLNIFQMRALQNKHFVFGLVTFDYMSAVFDATLHELYMDGDDEEFFYQFKYISETT